MYVVATLRRASTIMVNAKGMAISRSRVDLLERCDRTLQVSLARCCDFASSGNDLASLRAFFVGADGSVEPRRVDYIGYLEHRHSTDVLVEPSEIGNHVVVRPTYVVVDHDG